MVRSLYHCVAVVFLITIFLFRWGANQAGMFLNRLSFFTIIILFHSQEITIGACRSIHKAIDRSRTSSSSSNASSHDQNFCNLTTLNYEVDFEVSTICNFDVITSSCTTTLAK